MKTVGNNALMGVNQEALSLMKNRIRNRFAVTSFVIFGSAARDEADAESDVDVLVLTEKTLSHRERHEITDIVGDVNYQYDTNFSVLVVDIDSWEHGMISVMPIRDEVERDGIIV